MNGSLESGIFVFVLQLVHSVCEKVLVLSGDALDLISFEEDALFGHSADFTWVAFGKSFFSIFIHDVLVMEVLDGTGNVFDAGEWDLAFTFWVASESRFPHFCYLDLFRFESDWLDESKFEENLRKLSTINLQSRIMLLSLLWVINDAHVHTHHIEVIVISVVHHFIRIRTNLCYFLWSLLLS